MPSDNGQPGVATIGRRTSHRPEIDVTRRGQHFDLIPSTFGVGTSVDFQEHLVESSHHQLISIGIVVAVFVSSIDQALSK